MLLQMGCQCVTAAGYHSNFSACILILPSVCCTDMQPTCLLITGAPHIHWKGGWSKSVQYQLTIQEAADIMTVPVLPGRAGVHGQEEFAFSIVPSPNATVIERFTPYGFRGSSDAMWLQLLSFVQPCALFLSSCLVCVLCHRLSHSSCEDIISA